MDVGLFDSFQQPDKSLSRIPKWILRHVELH